MLFISLVVFGTAEGTRAWRDAAAGYNRTRAGKQPHRLRVPPNPGHSSRAQGKGGKERKRKLARLFPQNSQDATTETICGGQSCGEQRGDSSMQALMLHTFSPCLQRPWRRRRPARTGPKLRRRPDFSRILGGAPAAIFATIPFPGPGGAGIVGEVIMLVVMVMHSARQKRKIVD